MREKKALEGRGKPRRGEPQGDRKPRLGETQPTTYSQWRGVVDDCLTAFLGCDTPCHHSPALPQTSPEICSTSRPCAGSIVREGQNGGSAQHGSEPHEETASVGSPGCQEGATAAEKQAARCLTQASNLSPSENLPGHQTGLWAFQSVEMGGEYKGTWRQHTFGFSIRHSNCLHHFEIPQEVTGSWVNPASYQGLWAVHRESPRPRSGFPTPSLSLCHLPRACSLQPGLRSQTEPLAKASLCWVTSQEACCFHFPVAETETQGEKTTCKGMQ